jgi:hypothetical protein
VIRVWRLGKTLSARTSGDPLDETEVEDGREDGNLIQGGGIFLGKGRDGRKCRSMLEMSTPARTRIWKLSYNSGGSRFRI